MWSGPLCHAPRRQGQGSSLPAGTRHLASALRAQSTGAFVTRNHEGGGDVESPTASPKRLPPASLNRGKGGRRPKKAFCTLVSAESLKERPHARRGDRATSGTALGPGTPDSTGLCTPAEVLSPNRCSLLPQIPKGTLRLETHTKKAWKIMNCSVDGWGRVHVGVVAAKRAKTLSASACLDVKQAFEPLISSPRHRRDCDWRDSAPSIRDPYR